MFETLKKQDLVKRITLYKIRAPKYQGLSKKSLAKLKRSALIDIYKKQLAQDEGGNRMASVVKRLGPLR